MWSYYHHEWPRDINDLAEPHYSGRRLDVGGFVLADSFDTFLRNLSESYLNEAWLRVLAVRERYQLYPTDLSWGFVHPGEANIPKILLDKPLHAPHHWVGWTSKELDQFNQDSHYATIDQDLRDGSPRLRCAITWRSGKWRIAPDDFTAALRLIEVLCTAEPSDWAPSVVLDSWDISAPSEPRRDVSEPWVKVALAIRHKDQQELDSALSEAQAAYKPIAYRIVVRGYATHLYDEELFYGGESVNVRMPLDVLDDSQT